MADNYHFLTFKYDLHFSTLYCLIAWLVYWKDLCASIFHEKMKQYIQTAIIFSKKKEEEKNDVIQMMFHVIYLQIMLFFYF